MRMNKLFIVLACLVSVSCFGLEFDRELNVFGPNEMLKLKLHEQYEGGECKVLSMFSNPKNEEGNLYILFLDKDGLVIEAAYVDNIGKGSFNKPIIIKSSTWDHTAKVCPRVL